jgi:hypothetical protein
MYIPDNWDNIDNWGLLKSRLAYIWVNIKFKAKFDEAEILYGSLINLIFLIFLI